MLKSSQGLASVRATLASEIPERVPVIRKIWVDLAVVLTDTHFVQVVLE